MTWTRLSDNFADRPELLECSRSARLLHVEALVYANRQSTDGRIPTSAIPRFSDTTTLGEDLAELERAGVWRQLHAGAWQIEGWEDREHQESAAAVQAREKYNRDKQTAYRKRKADHAAKNHESCSPVHCAGRRRHDAGDHTQCRDGCLSTVTGNATSHETSHETSQQTGGVTNGVTHSPPLPAQPLPKGQGQGRCAHGYPVIREADGSTTTGCPDCTHTRPAAKTANSAVRAEAS